MNAINCVKGALTILACVALTACGGGGDGALPFGSTTSTASAPPACTPRVVTVVLTGDSTMVGPENLMLPRMQAAMDARFGAGAVDVSSVAVSGTNALQVPPVTADVIVNNDGINDELQGETLPVYRAALLAIHATLQETANPTVAHPGADAYVDVAKGLGVPIADTRAFVLGLPNWQSMLYPDGIHPMPPLNQLIVDKVLAPAVAAQVAPLRCTEAGA